MQLNWIGYFLVKDFSTTPSEGKKEVLALDSLVFC